MHNLHLQYHHGDTADVIYTYMFIFHSILLHMCFVVFKVYIVFPIYKLHIYNDNKTLYVQSHSISIGNRMFPIDILCDLLKSLLIQLS